MNKILESTISLDYLKDCCYSPQDPFNFLNDSPQDPFDFLNAIIKLDDGTLKGQIKKVLDEQQNLPNIDQALYYDCLHILDTNKDNSTSYKKKALEYYLKHLKDFFTNTSHNYYVTLKIIPRLYALKVNLKVDAILNNDYWTIFNDIADFILKESKFFKKGLNWQFKRIVAYYLICVCNIKQHKTEWDAILKIYLNDVSQCHYYPTDCEWLFTDDNLSSLDLELMHLSDTCRNSFIQKIEKTKNFIKKNNPSKEFKKYIDGQLSCDMPLCIGAHWGTTINKYSELKFLANDYLHARNQIHNLGNTHTNHHVNKDKINAFNNFLDKCLADPPQEYLAKGWNFCLMEIGVQLGYTPHPNGEQHNCSADDYKIDIINSYCKEALKLNNSLFQANLDDIINSLYLVPASLKSRIKVTISLLVNQDTNEHVKELCINDLIFLVEPILATYSKSTVKGNNVREEKSALPALIDELSNNHEYTSWLKNKFVPIRNERAHKGVLYTNSYYIFFTLLKIFQITREELKNEKVSFGNNTIQKEILR